MATVLSILLIIVSLVMIVTVLLQSSDEDGLGALSGRSNDSYFSKSKAKTMEARLALGTKVTAGVFVALSLISEGKIGLGDGLLMTVTGLFLGGRQNAFLIMTAMLLSALFSIGYLLSKKGNRKTRFAFVPFMFASFLIRMTAGRFL